MLMRYGAHLNYELLSLVEQVSCDCRKLFVTYGNKAEETDEMLFQWQREIFVNASAQRVCQLRQCLHTYIIDNIVCLK